MSAKSVIEKAPDLTVKVIFCVKFAPDNTERLPMFLHPMCVRHGHVLREPIKVQHREVSKCLQLPKSMVQSELETVFGISNDGSAVRGLVARDVESSEGFQLRENGKGSLAVGEMVGECQVEIEYEGVEAFMTGPDFSVLDIVRDNGFSFEDSQEGAGLEEQGDVGACDEGALQEVEFFNRLKVWFEGSKTGRPKVGLVHG